AHGGALQGRPGARGGGGPRRTRRPGRPRRREHGRGPGLSVAMPDLDLIKTLSPLGVGGLLAVMIFVFYRLDFLRERQNHQVERVRVSPALEIETGPRTSGVPHLVSRILVTAALDDDNWAEWRHWVGQAVVETARSEIQMPPWLRDTQDHALAEVSRRVDEAGFFIREGIPPHERGVMGTFRR